ncbi:MAG TPA: PH domain-containing protein [Opitutaceae bacterium]|nr:PH domain-containing protein [Opitutaceae bacterium]
MRHYPAPWSTSLIAVSSLATLLCLGSAGAIAWQGRGLPSWVGLLPLAIIAGGALFTIRGYTVAADVILVHRLCWATRLPLAGLESARFEPDAMRRSIRTFGNGGLFSFAGYFRNKPLGAYRALVTDPHQTVVLRYAGRTVVISPSAPEEFVRSLLLATSAPRGN